MNRRGVALILTILIVALVSASVLSFIRLAELDARVAENVYAFTQAEVLAHSGLKGAMLLLAMDEKEYDALNDPWANFDQYAMLAGGLFEEGTFAGRIEDLSARIGINSLVDGNNLVLTERADMLTRLFNLLGHDPAPVDALLDWLDRDSEPRANGAEDPYYSSLDQPYPCGDGALASLGQLGLIRGFTPALLYGTDSSKGISEYLTVHSQGLVNINTAGETVLQCLDDDLTPSVAQEIMELRAAEPFYRLDDLKRITGLTPEARLRIGPLVGSERDFFPDRDRRPFPRRSGGGRSDRRAAGGRRENDLLPGRLRK